MSLHRDDIDQLPFPPGLVPRARAAKMFGVALGTWDQWEKSGRVAIPRHSRRLTKGPPWVLYALDDLTRLLAEWRAAPPPSIPEGFVTREGAAKILGIGLRTWVEWESGGKETIPRRSVKIGKGRPTVLYAIADVERLRDEIENRPPPQPPPGLVGRLEAARLLDLSPEWWGDMERSGRVPVQCVWVPSGKGTPYKMYPLDELLAFREEWRQRFEPRPDPARPGCCRIPLVYRLYDPREAIFDAASRPLVQGRRWHWEARDDGSPGAVALASTSGSNLPLKRVVLGLEDAGPEVRVSHANGDPLDCRRENLVVRSITEQLHATRKKGIISGVEYTSIYKGVSWDKPRERWKTQIQHEGKNRFVGRYDTKEEAARAYDQAAREHFSVHDTFNFPGPGERSALPPRIARGAA